MNRIGMQAQLFPPEIVAGRLNKAETEFLDKQVITAEAVAVVGDYVRRQHDGELLVELGDMRIHIKVGKSGGNDA